MYSKLTSIAFGSAFIWSAASACQYTQKTSAVMIGNDALRVPIASTGPGALNECASTAQAFGLSSASIVPKDQGGAECVVFGAQNTGKCGEVFEAHEDATTLLNISECAEEEVKAIADAAILLQDAGEEAAVGGTTAMQIAGTAAVGKAVHSDLSVVTEQECLVACTEYIEGCTHVTTVVAQGEMVKCSFHGTPKSGVEVPGANTYYDIIPNAQLASRTLGQAPAEEDDAAAPADDADAPVGAIEKLLFTAPGECTGEVITDVPAGFSEPSLTPPVQVFESYADVVGDDGKFPLAYDEIVNGGAYCVAKGSTAETVIVGGMFFWDDAGECVPPPTTEDGEACCEVLMWQPNTAGLYYDNCSMKMQIQPNGLYYFETEMPGDESLNGWGPDPEPHIHYDVICTGCDGDHPVVQGDYQYWNKFYPETLCTIEGCGEQGPEHQATELAAGGQTVYKYDFVLPGQTRTQNK